MGKPMSNEELARELGRGYDQNYARRLKICEENQRRVAREFGDNRRSVEGLGQPVMELDVKVDQEIRKRYGNKAMKDPDFRKWLQRNHDSVRVKSGGTKTQFGYTGK